MYVKLRYHKDTVHAHVRLFTGRDRDHLRMAGSFTVGTDEFEQLVTILMNGVSMLRDFGVPNVLVLDPLGREEQVYGEEAVGGHDRRAEAGGGEEHGAAASAGGASGGLEPSVQGGAGEAGDRVDSASDGGGEGAADDPGPAGEAPEPAPVVAAESGGKHPARGAELGASGAFGDGVAGAEAPRPRRPGRPPGSGRRKKGS